MAKNGYTTLNLPTSLVEELKIWQTAFSATYGKKISYSEMIRGMLDSMEETEPAVVDVLDKIVQRNPELESKIARFRSSGGEV